MKLVSPNRSLINKQVGEKGKFFLTEEYQLVAILGGHFVIQHNNWSGQELSMDAATSRWKFDNQGIYIVPKYLLTDYSLIIKGKEYSYSGDCKITGGHHLNWVIKVHITSNGENR